MCKKRFIVFICISVALFALCFILSCDHGTDAAQGVFLRLKLVNGSVGYYHIDTSRFWLEEISTANLTPYTQISSGTHSISREYSTWSWQFSLTDNGYYTLYMDNPPNSMEIIRDK